MSAEKMIVDGFLHRFELVDSGGRVLDTWVEHNIIPKAGLDFLIQSPFGLASPVSSFYAGLLSGNYLPTSASTAADLPANEFVGYSEAARPAWNRTYDGVGTLDNSNSRATFTFTQDRTIYAAFLVSSAVKGGADGLLLSCVRFSSPRSVSAGLTLNLASGITYVATNVA